MSLRVTEIVLIKTVLTVQGVYEDTNDAHAKMLVYCTP